MAVMDLLQSLVSFNGEAGSSQRSSTMLSSQATPLPDPMTGVTESINDTEALVVGLASSPRYNTLPNRPRTSERVDQYDPPPSAQPNQDENEPPMPTHYQGLQLQSIEDFERENPYNPKSKQKIIPPGKVNSGMITLFHYLCQDRGIQPDFTYSEALSGGFTAKVMLGAITEEITQPHPSKQAAKEVVCQLGISHLKALPSKASNKRKAVSDAETPKAQLDTSENWIGVLQEYTQAERLLVPDYEATPTSQGQWACICTITFAGGLSKQFGLKDIGFPSKQGAKATAAKEAVVWLRENGKLSPPGAKRQKVADPSNLPAGQTGLSQAFRAFGVESQETIPQRIERLIRSLGLLHAPSYDIQASTFSSGQAALAQGYWDVAATFDSRDVAKIPELGGRIGEVKHIFGKAKAKEACGRKVVQVLEELESRGVS